jgi:regulator of protease activity HflC (stomatin/prohibitin superfamily)
MRLLVFGGWSELPPARWLRLVGERVRRIDEAVDLTPAWPWCVAHRRRLAFLAAGGLAVWYASFGFVAIEPGEVGLVQRFGGDRGQIGPGLHFRLPPPFERVIRVQPERVRSLPLGFRDRRPAADEPLRWESGHGRTGGEEDGGDGLLVTGDGQLLEIMATLQYAVDAASPGAVRRFALGVDQPEQALGALAEAAVREVVGRGRLLDLLTVGRRDAEAEATTRLRKRLSGLELGIVVHSITFLDVHPPLAVVDAYRDVSRAESDRQRRTNEAAAYRAEKLADAQARAAAGVAAARTDRECRLARASAAADAFAFRSASRQTSARLTDFRLFWETLGRVLPGKPKLILGDGRQRSQRLILPAVPPALAAALAAGGASASAPASPAPSPAPPNNTSTGGKP